MRVVIQLLWEFPLLLCVPAISLGGCSENYRIRLLPSLACETALKRFSGPQSYIPNLVGLRFSSTGSGEANNLLIGVSFCSSRLSSFTLRFGCAKNSWRS